MVAGSNKRAVGLCIVFWLGWVRPSWKNGDGRLFIETLSVVYAAQRRIAHVLRVRLGWWILERKLLLLVEDIKAILCVSVCAWVVAIEVCERHRHPISFLRIQALTDRCESQA